MKKVLRLQRALLREIDKYDALIAERDYHCDWERLHIASCARVGYMLAEERGIDPVLAACACSMHDYGRIITGKQKNHAEAGYQPAMEFLRSTAMFTEEEVKQMGIAVKNHSLKSQIGTPLEEIVKDADVIDFYQYGYEMPREEQKARLRKLLGDKYKE